MSEIFIGLRDRINEQTTSLIGWLSARAALADSIAAQKCGLFHRQVNLRKQTNVGINQVGPQPPYISYVSRLLPGYLNYCSTVIHFVEERIGLTIATRLNYSSSRWSKMSPRHPRPLPT